MTDVRTAFLSVASDAAAVLREDALAQRWDEPSALADMTIGALAAHTGRAVLVTGRYLAAAPPAADAGLVDAAGYMLGVLGEATHDDDVHVGIRARAADGASDGPAALAEAVDDALAELRTTLPGLPQDTRVEVRDGLALLLDEYLATRIVELVVHLDDVAASIGDDPVELDPTAARVAVGTLAELARRRTSTSAVVRTLARRERAPGGVHAF